MYAVRGRLAKYEPRASSVQLSGRQVLHHGFQRSEADLPKRSQTRYAATRDERPNTAGPSRHDYVQNVEEPTTNRILLRALIQPTYYHLLQTPTVSTCASDPDLRRRAAPMASS